MRLSEAMRRGATLHPQAFGHYFDVGLAGEIVASCAIGCSLEAVGITNNPSTQQINYIFPVLIDSPDTSCPADCGFSGDLGSTICHLNNSHWTRERIADWVETIENQVYPQPVPALLSAVSEQETPSTALVPA
jgi:hypothetical protein